MSSSKHKLNYFQPKYDISCEFIIASVLRASSNSNLELIFKALKKLKIFPRNFKYTFMWSLLFSNEYLVKY